ncbi:hypothetical protein ACFXHD_13050 [Streptomyces hydrogenans]|uniref:hypothetical protein n=1 Tax=Streptomyces hydrogenans TaxID=1873719 RepID=UPI0036AAAC0F
MDIFEPKPTAAEAEVWPESGRPVQLVSVSISALSFRARADGDTGWAALRRIRPTNPWLAWGTAAYAVVLVALVVGAS